MPTIDADAHIHESDKTWDYMEGSDEKFRPVLVGSPDGQKSFWLIDGSVFRRGGNVNKQIAADVREMRDIEGRLRHMDDLEIDIQVLYPSLFLRPLTKRPEVETANRFASCITTDQRDLFA